MGRRHRIDVAALVALALVALAGAPSCALVLGYGDFTEEKPDTTAASTSGTGGSGTGGASTGGAATGGGGATGGADGGLPPLVADWSYRGGDGALQAFNQVALGPSGDILVAGNYTGAMTLFGAPISTPGGLEIVAAQVSASDGAPVWTKGTVDVPPSGTSTPRGAVDIAAGADGSVYLSGYWKNAANGNDGFLAGLDGTSSPEQWITTFDGGGGNYASRLAVDSSQHIRLIAEANDGHFVFGATQIPAGPVSGKDIALATCAATPCASASVAIFGGPLDDLATSIAPDPNPGGAVFIGGEYRATWATLPDTGSTPAILVMKASGTGAPAWTRGFVKTQGAACTASNLQHARANAVAATPSGDVVVTGVMCGETEFGPDESDGSVKLPGKGGADVFVVRLRGSTGKLMWARSYGDPGEQIGTGVGIGKDGAVFLTGTFAGKLDLGGSVLDAGPVSEAIFLVELDGASGEHRRSALFGGGEPIEYRPIALAASPTLVVLAGTWKTTLAFGDGTTLDPKGGLDAFLARFTP